ncbi:hypothetical protein Slin14017_G109830 [Septoria linicola]|nr:hypothetical protein Slin14017_G109830 [Septoria linicola]
MAKLKILAIVIMVLSPTYANNDMLQKRKMKPEKRFELLFQRYSTPECTPESAIGTRKEGIGKRRWLNNDGDCQYFEDGIPWRGYGYK